MFLCLLCAIVPVIALVIDVLVPCPYYCYVLLLCFLCALLFVLVPVLCYCNWLSGIARVRGLVIVRCGLFAARYYCYLLSVRVPVLCYCCCSCSVVDVLVLGIAHVIVRVL